ncbi:MAG: M20/M25/M40 family metallo-hydrolase [bacterium]|nr:M20/M25/M40 family metallo-hydrolase [bacterium]
MSITPKRRIAATTGTLLLGCTGCLHISPGTLYESSTEPLTHYQREMREELVHDVNRLSTGIGPRHGGASLAKVLEAERWILGRLTETGVDATRDEVDLNGPKVANVVATFPGAKQPSEIVLIGAHYDAVPGSPGANDNASGVALLLATARRLRDTPTGRTVRIVFFVNEENPFSGGLQMGSRVHAGRSRARGDDIVAMIAVDSVGYYSSEPNSQDYPAYIWGLPSKANFVAFVSNRDNQDLVDRIVEIFQAESRFPSIGIATDMKSAGRSDHAPFWWQDYPALVFTDTSEARDPNYHAPTDTPDQLDYDEMARMAEGFVRTVVALADTETQLR